MLEALLEPFPFLIFFIAINVIAWAVGRITARVDDLEKRVTKIEKQEGWE